MGCDADRRGVAQGRLWVPYRPTDATAAVWERARRIAAMARHALALNYDGTDMDRAWGHELQRGAPSGGAKYPVGWWGMGSRYQPNHDLANVADWPMYSNTVAGPWVRK